MKVRTFSLLSMALLGFLSGILGLIAESKKIEESSITRLSETDCVHPRSPALVLGLLAAITLLISQIISVCLGGCICCKSRSKNLWVASKYIQTRTEIQMPVPMILAVSFLILSWMLFSIAFLLLVSSAIINEKRHDLDNLSSECIVLRSGVFTGGALASFTTTALGIAYNLLVISIKKVASSSSYGTTENQGPSVSGKRCSAIGQLFFSNEQHICTGTPA